ncbi:MAG TPA: ferritin-like protein [Acidimicrobiia bacterium]
MTIETTEELREHLHAALNIELAAIPPYLYAMYSITDQRSEAAMLIRSIVVEEMLHAALVGNLLLAIGARPRFADPSLIPSFPMEMPYHEPPLELRLGRATEDLVRDIFMRLEQPEEHRHPSKPGVYETLGQFYHAIETAIRDFGESGSLFSNPQRSSQMSDRRWYTAVDLDDDDSGGLVLVDDMDSAIEAIEIIIHQGEGLADHRWADTSHHELTHYYKLVRIAEGAAPLPETHPVPENPRLADFPGDVAVVATLFNASYRSLYLVLAELFSPRDDKGRLVGRLYGLMSAVLGPLAGYMVSLPLDDSTVAAPTFERYQFSSDDPDAELLALAERAVEVHPDLRPVAEAIVLFQDSRPG